ncbi:hypothetical protein BM1_00648 [Bipolaris maydis]|nr:hypothetical protein BM1_00648 [Bipolaris maydis]
MHSYLLHPHSLSITVRVPNRSALSEDSTIVHDEEAGWKMGRVWDWGWVGVAKNRVGVMVGGAVIHICDE